MLIYEILKELSVDVVYSIVFEPIIKEIESLRQDRQLAREIARIQEEYRIAQDPSFVLKKRVMTLEDALPRLKERGLYRERDELSNLINSIKDDNGRLDDDAENIMTTIIKALFSPNSFSSLTKYLTIIIDILREHFKRSVALIITTILIGIAL